MNPIERILTEGDITWRLDRGWRIVEADGSLWWRHPYAAAFGSDRACRPTMALTDHETEVWETMRKETTMTDPATTLANALPKDPGDHGPIAVPSDAVRGVLAELDQRRKTTVTLPGPVIGGTAPLDGGA